LLSAPVAQRLQVLHIGLDRFSEIGESEWQQIGVGEPQHRDPSSLCECSTIDEGRIAEVHEPVEIVVDRVIDPAFILTAIPKIE